MSEFLYFAGWVLAGFVTVQAFRIGNRFMEHRIEQRKEAHLAQMKAIQNQIAGLTTDKEAPMAKMYRQGDVLLVKVREMPRSAGKLVTPNDRIVLAYGEVTGHAHAIYPEVEEREPGVAPKEGQHIPKLKAKLWDAGAERYLQVLEKTALRHEEHTPIELDKGVYRVIRQREYDPVRDRYVAD